MPYTIGEVAAKIGVSAHTLRYYDKEGLMPFTHRNSSGVRLFTENDLDWLNIIECLKRSGLTIREIRQYALWVSEGNGSIEERREMFYARREATRQKIAELTTALELLDYKCWYYDVASETQDETVPRGMALDELPEDIARIARKFGKNGAPRTEGIIASHAEGSGSSTSATAPTSVPPSGGESAA